jgi:hypothetical protein
MFLGKKKENSFSDTEKDQTGQIRQEWIFVDKGNYLMRSLPFSL